MSNEINVHLDLLVRSPQVSDLPVAVAAPLPPPCGRSKERKTGRLEEKAKRMHRPEEKMGPRGERQCGQHFTNHFLKDFKANLLKGK